jgi:hypothetical protein
VNTAATARTTPIAEVGPKKSSLSRRAAAFVMTVLAVAISCVLPASNAMGSPSLGPWSVATTPSPSGNWTAVDFADGQFVAVGHGSYVAVSSNGSTWTEDPVPTGAWQTETFGGGQFLALSSASAANQEMISTNGVNWSAQPGPSGPWTGLTYGEGRFVAVSSNGQIVTSSDGDNWTEAWHHQNYDLTSVAYGDGHFVATDTAMGAIIISTNGVDWSRLLPLRTGLKWGAVAYGNGNFVVVDGSGSGLTATSVYGYDWTLHPYSPAEAVTDATFGCGTFVAAGQSTGTTNNFFSSANGSTWTAAAVAIGDSSDWTGVAYGAHRFVAVDSAGDIAWSSYPASCAAVVPSTPQQVSGNVHSGEVWTYMHPSAAAGGARVDSYRVTISNGTVTKQCTAPVYFQPNCIIRGLVNHEVYTVTTQAHNRFGYSVMTDPEFVIPVTSWSLSAVTTASVISESSPVVVQVTGVIANSEGIYPVAVITVHFGARLLYCHPNPFGECLITVPNPAVGVTPIYATYTGYGRSYTSPTSHVTIQP